MSGIAIPPDGGETVDRGSSHFRVLAELPQFEVIEVWFEPGAGNVAPHVHDDHVDSFYVLAGRVEFTVGAEVFEAGPGSYVAAPAGVEHGFRNTGDTDLRMLNAERRLRSGASRLEPSIREAFVPIGARWTTNAAASNRSSGRSATRSVLSPRSARSSTSD